MNFKEIEKRLKKIPPVYKLLGVIFINILIFAASYYYIIVPQSKHLEKLYGEYNTVNEQWVKMMAIKNKIQETKAEYEEVEKRLKALFTQLPETKDIPNLLRHISRLANESQLRIKFFEPKSLINREFYAELPFELKYTGSYHNVGYFFDGIRKMERIVRIDDFTLEAKGTLPKIYLEGLCNAKAFVYVKEQPKPKKEEKKDAKK